MISKIRKIFNRRAKVIFGVLTLLIIFGATLETVALAIISPFISIMMEPSIVETNHILAYVYNLFGFQSPRGFLAMLAVGLAAVYAFRGLYVFWLGKTQYLYLAKRRVELSDKLMRKNLAKPYIYHTGKNVAELQNIIMGDATSFMGLVTSYLALFTDGFMSLFILVYLFYSSWAMTLAVLAMASFCVFIYIKVFRKRIYSLGERNRQKAMRMIKTLQQALGGIKELKVLKREQHFQSEFKVSSDDAAVTSSRLQIINTLPKLMVETVCFSLAFVLVAIYILSGADVQALVPTLSVFVLAAFRLLPAITRLIGCVSSIIQATPSADAIMKSLFDEDEFNFPSKPSGGSEMYMGEDGKGAQDGDILINHIYFAYPSTGETVLRDVSLIIKKNSATAFVGPSGAGKTTLADIVLGVLIPGSGAVYYGGRPIGFDPDAWGNQIGYIPQNIYLLDESIRENVAFGYRPDEIDDERVWHALEEAQIADFIRGTEHGLDTKVGERGILLSGGQRQRIGIARALYDDPQVLILDEATSALDNDTESAVMDAIMGLHGAKTIIIIAHRLSTIEHCDTVYKVDHGKVTKER
jgi:ABC-type multidrug transport system fused ATPase/permease subunit